MNVPVESSEMLLAAQIVAVIGQLDEEIEYWDTVASSADDTTAQIAEARACSYRLARIAILDALEANQNA